MIRHGSAYDRYAASFTAAVLLSDPTLASGPVARVLARRGVGHGLTRVGGQPARETASAYLPSRWPQSPYFSRYDALSSFHPPCSKSTRAPAPRR